MASRNVMIRPAKAVKGSRWVARLTIDAPGRATSPAAHLIVKKRNGTLVKRAVPLSRKGHGKVTIPFSSSTVRSATITLVNASTRFRCWRQVETFSCQGKPRDNGQKFGFRAALIKR